jgi:hypothetical protein
MIFGRFKGLGADRSRHHALYALFATLCVFFLFGFLGGLPELGRPRFQWDFARILYFIGELVCFAGCVWSAVKYEDADTRYGAIGFAALPLFVVLAVSAHSIGIC